MIDADPDTQEGPEAEPAADPAAGPAAGPTADTVGLERRSKRSIQTWKRAQNMQTVGLTEGAYVGRLEDFQFDLESHRVYGYRIKATGYFGKAGGVAARHLQLIGRDVAFVDTAASVEWGMTGRKAVEGRAWASAYRGTQAITRRGRALGAVQDFVLDSDGQHVTGILLHGDRLLPLDGRVHSGPAAVIAADDDVVVELSHEEDDAESPTWWARLGQALKMGGDKDEPGEP
ncbi:MAG: hypothetical protein H6742_10460 [Alphaproteobacteria bacterium]|nr:hypothetical protein [Alphaproteobacteria bacterium]